MSSLFVDTHNMVAILMKSDAAEGFEQIIDFLSGSYIQYALTVNPHIYVSCIKQFWNTALVKRSDDVTRRWCCGGDEPTVEMSRLWRVTVCDGGDVAVAVAAAWWWGCCGEETTMVVYKQTRRTLLVRSQTPKPTHPNPSFSTTKRNLLVKTKPHALFSVTETKPHALLVVLLWWWLRRWCCGGDKPAVEGDSGEGDCHGVEMACGVVVGLLWWGDHNGGGWRCVMESEVVDLIDRETGTFLGFAENARRKSFPPPAVAGGGCRKYGREESVCYNFVIYEKDV
nr:hypothetical protein [Tanacetum cinerariifolium]